MAANGHHIWCNFWSAGDADDCAMCKRFKAQYPEDGSAADMVAKYFPKAHVVTDPATTDAGRVHFAGFSESLPWPPRTR